MIDQRIFNTFKNFFEIKKNALCKVRLENIMKQKKPNPANLFIVSAGVIAATAGETIQMPINMIGNPGISAIGLSIETESPIKLQDVKGGSILPLIETKEDLLWQAEKDTHLNGCLAELNLTVPPAIKKGGYAVRIILNKCRNHQSAPIIPIIMDGMIYIL